MRLFVTVFFAILLSLNTIIAVRAWPVAVSRSETAAKSMMEIPQWHCLRYFKHDIHLQRRCRNYRVPMIRRPVD